MPAPYPIRLAQWYWRRYIQLPYWMVVTITPHVFGRWYVFRNAPTWFVRLVSMIEVLDTDEPFMVSLVHEAKKELRTRQKRHNTPQGTL